MLKQCRQLTAQERKIEEGEQQLGRLRREMTELSRQNHPRAGDGTVPNRDPELAIRLSQLEEGMIKRGRWSIKHYLSDQVHDMVTSSLQREQVPESAFPERARPESTRLTKAARKGDSRVEVEDSNFCRIGEIVLIGGQELEQSLERVA